MEEIQGKEKVMPTTRKRISRGQVIGAGGFSEDAYQYYSSGPFFGGEDFEQGKTEEELKAFWNKHRQAIMERFMAELRLKVKGWEGHRPDRYWQDLKDSGAAPRLHLVVKLADNELYDNKKVEPSGREADFAYLKRLGLLEDWEIEK